MASVLVSRYITVIHDYDVTTQIVECRSLLRHGKSVRGVTRWVLLYIVMERDRDDHFSRRPRLRWGRRRHFSDALLIKFEADASMC